MDNHNPSNSVCVIGGSGFYDFLSKPLKENLSTPFGSVTLYHQIINDRRIFFLPRHGEGHYCPPHMINYKANVFAIHTLDISRVITTNAVGSLHHSIQPGDYVILDQFIDFVRPLTFFDGIFKVKFSNATTLSGVVHVDMTEPYCPELRKVLLKSLGSSKNIHSKGTYVTAMGPRFETAAEIRALKYVGADVVGMTNSSEAILCRELGICYGTIAVVTNMAAGLQKNITQQEVIKIFNSRLSELKRKILEVIDLIPKHRDCSCSSHIK